MTGGMSSNGLFGMLKRTGHRRSEEALEHAVFDEEVGIVVPSNPIAKLLGDNVAEAKRLERELQIFKKAYHVPTVVFGLE